MALSRLRWGLGAAIALMALVVAVRALGAYVEHRLWLGSASVLLLVAIAIGGLYSLGQARLRVERALAELAATTFGQGGWLAARRATLERVRDSGAPLDLDAIAAATAAEERGRAYLGRYLVAVTVLVGLVGTFAGLMETLREVAPLLRDDRLSTAQALAAPLAGLDVTFGASVVGILVTLALALVQGDLVLAEEQALARLEERTAHELVPSLWPAAARADERLVAEVAALRRELQASLAATGEATAARVAAATRGEIEQLVAATRATLERVGDAVAQTMRTAEASARASAEAHAQALQSATQTTHDALRAATAAATETLRGTVGAAEATLRSAADGAASAMGAASSAAALAARESSQSVGVALRESTELAARSLADAAAGLRESSGSLSSSLATLAPELAALAREVALLAARPADDGAAPAIADELVRLGDGVERLEQLLERERRERA